MRSATYSVYLTACHKLQWLQAQASSMFVGRSRVEITYLYLYMCIFLPEGFGHQLRVHHHRPSQLPHGIGDAFGIEQLVIFAEFPDHPYVPVMKQVLMHSASCICLAACQQTPMADQRRRALCLWADGSPVENAYLYIYRYIFSPAGSGHQIHVHIPRLELWIDT